MYATDINDVYDRSQLLKSMNTRQGWNQVICDDRDDPYSEQADIFIYIKFGKEFEYQKLLKCFVVFKTGDFTTS